MPLIQNHGMPFPSPVSRIRSHTSTASILRLPLLRRSKLRTATCSHIQCVMLSLLGDIARNDDATAKHIHFQQNRSLLCQHGLKMLLACRSHYCTDSPSSNSRTTTPPDCDAAQQSYESRVPRDLGVIPHKQRKQTKSTQLPSNANQSHKRLDTFGK